MHGKYECKNAHEKQEKTQNKKSSRSNKKTCQEQLEDHEEHYECMRFSKKCKKNFKSMQLTPNLKINTRLKQETQNIFDFYDFLNFFVFLLIFFEKHFWKNEKEKKNF